MGGRNTTGLANPNNFLLGRGKLYFAELDANQKPKGYRHLGNAPQFSLNVAREDLEHRSSLEGLSTIDKVVTISQDLNFSFNLEEVDHDNLSALLSGETADHTNVAVAGFSQHAMIAAADVALGRWYDIVNSSGARAYDIDAADLTVASAAPTSLVLNTDYEVDTEFGRIFLKSTSTVVAAAISGNHAINVTLAAKSEARDVHEVRALTQTSVYGALKFISVNPANEDEQVEYQFHKIKLTSEGDFSLIGNEFSQMPFTGSAEKALTHSPNSPTLTIRQLAPADS